MIPEILNKKSALALIASVTGLMIVTSPNALAAGAPPGAVAAVHAEAAKTTTGAEESAEIGAPGAGGENALAIPTVLYDPTRPFYIGATLGWGDIYQSVFSGPAQNSSSSGFAGRIYAGYRFTDTISVEGGYSKFSDVTGSYSTFSPIYGPLNAKGVIRTYAFDAVVKLMLPLKDKFNRFSVYGKLGIAYLNEMGGTLNTDALILPRVPGSPVQPINDTNPIGNKLLPTFSLGLNYHLIKDLEADLVWMHIQAMGTTGLNNTDFVGLGLAYSL